MFPKPLVVFGKQVFVAAAIVCAPSLHAGAQEPAKISDILTAEAAVEANLATPSTVNGTGPQKAASPIAADDGSNEVQEDGSAKSPVLLTSDEFPVDKAAEDETAGSTASLASLTKSTAQPVPVQPPQPVQPPDPIFSPNNANVNFPDFSSFGNFTPTPGAVSAIFDAADAQRTDPTPDLGQLLSRSGSSGAIEAQRRSSVSFDPNIRGYRQGQVYTSADNGAYYFAVRQDLDSMLSKIDPSSISDVIVISGPYGVQYGPGFSFIDIVTDAPRPNSNDYKVLFNTRTNGGQVAAREIAEIGGADWGLRASTGQRFGNDYRAGNGLDVPGSYRLTDIVLEHSFYLSRDRRLDFTYRRLDQGDTAYPVSFFDINSLVSNAFSTRYVDTDADSPWTKMSVGGWYNYNKYNGDTANKSNPNFAIVPRVEDATDIALSQPLGTTTIAATTVGANLSTGARAGVQYGDVNDGSVMELHFGSDFRELKQGIGEQFATNIGGLGNFATNLPTSRQYDTGLYTMSAVQLTSNWVTRFGGRVDWVDSNVDQTTIIQPSILPGPPFSQSETLFSFYNSNEVDVTDNIKMRVAFGHGERAATLLERYADQIFVNLLQNGFTRVQSSRVLDKEKNNQMDLGFEGTHERLNWRVNGFYSFIDDYINLQVDPVLNPPFAAQLVSFINTGRATLSGVDFYQDFLWGPNFTTFSSFRYTEGRDVSLGTPLGQIFPFDATVGYRIHDSNRGRRWGIENNLRMVAKQTRLGQYQTTTPGTNYFESPTAGFAVVNIRGYYNFAQRGNRRLSLVAGVDNLFDKFYFTHLDVRLPATTPPATAYPLIAPFAPGITPYVNIEYAF
jgi:outer membrane receptor protein involved in Fe transport